MREGEEEERVNGGVTNKRGRGGELLNESEGRAKRKWRSAALFIPPGRKRGAPPLACSSFVSSVKFISIHPRSHPVWGFRFSTLLLLAHFRISCFYLRLTVASPLSQHGKWTLPRIALPLPSPPANLEPPSMQSESRLYSFSPETKEKLRKFRLGTSRAKDPQAIICRIPSPVVAT